MTPADKPGSAEKRALWEVRQRYQLDDMSRSSRRRTVSVPPPGQPPSRAAATVETAGPPPPPASLARGGAGGPPRPPTRRAGRIPGSSRRVPGSRRSWLRRGLLLAVLLAALSGGIFGYKIIAAGNKISSTDRSILGQLSDLLFSQGKTLGGESDGRINIALLAIGGSGHSGENLADTVMVASIKPETNEVALLSIPRDLYVQVPDEDYYTKINAVHAYGEQQGAGRGPEVLSQLITEITGQPIHYYVRVDFTAFKEIIDTVGGIDVTIENSFFDYWHKIAFSAGTEHMDGERALAFVRARYIEGPEGGDFKRAARQQQVLLAVQNKVFSVNTAFDFTAINSILNALSANIRTDMELWEMKRFYEIARAIDRSKVHSVVLTTGPQGVLVGTTEVLGGTPASVLKPKAGNYSEIQAMAANIFTSATIAPADNDTPVFDAEPPLEPESSPSPPPAELPTLEIRNGTNITGLAKQTSDELSAKNYEVLAIGNAATRDRTETTIYIIDQKFANQAETLGSDISAGTDSGLPDEESATDADLLVILGENAQ